MYRVLDMVVNGIGIQRRETKRKRKEKKRETKKTERQLVLVSDSYKVPPQLRCFKSS